MSRYEPLKIEGKWQAKWEDEEPFKATEKSDVAKMYLAEMFPYPSGAGLHVGHVRNFSIVDCLSRFYTQNGVNVMRPFGYDTFGLPAENYAIKTGISPQDATKTNIRNFRNQAKRLGFAIDWSREVTTSDPEYYRWTQWCFLQLFKKGLAYQKESYQWWCPVDKTVLANEQVEGGCCWRCGSEVEKKKMRQWFFKITDYADELLDEIDALDWPEKIKTMQKNWIGRSEGAEIEFAVAPSGDHSAGLSSQAASLRSRRDCERSPEATTSNVVTVFTTRPDTLFGATFLVLAPEHPLVPKLTTDDAQQAVDTYRTEAMKKSEIERQENKEKTGVFTGSYAINPASGAKMPIWVADYVLMGYGTGAIMAVPAHDERDFEFAQKFELPVVKVVEKPEGSADNEACYAGEGELVNSEQFNGRQSAEAREEIVAWAEQMGVGRGKVTYRMRDWLISRQRYWGAPIPIAYDKNGKAHAIPEDQLPVMLPEIDDYTPDDSGRSALAKHPEWTKVVIDGEEMTRETDTMDGYACSSWYLWRYCDPRNKKQAWAPQKVNYWAPTDIYCGADHAVAHLLYIRFWCKFFADLGLLDFREPVKKLLYNGYINAPDGKKMSKSKGNVIDPLDVIDQGYGADTLRTYELFIGPYDFDAAWDTKAIGGVYRFLSRCYNLVFSSATSDRPPENVLSRARSSSRGAVAAVRPEVGASSPSSAAVLRRRSEVARHRTIKKVTEDLHRNSFNTAVAALMEFVNDLYKSAHGKEDLVALARLLKPFAPHLASEMLEKLGADDTWPEWDEKMLVAETVEIVVQINGKLRARVAVDSAIVEDKGKLEATVMGDEKVAEQLRGKEVVKVIPLPKNRLVSIVIKI